jgi:hypothetical protein
MVVAQHPTPASQGVFIQIAGCLFLAKPGSRARCAASARTTC